MKNVEELSVDAINTFYKHIRTQKGYTQLQLSQALNHRSVGLVSQAELYLKKQHFNIEHLYKIAYVLNCNLSDLTDKKKEK